MIATLAKILGVTVDLPCLTPTLQYFATLNLFITIGLARIPLRLQ